MNGSKWSSVPAKAAYIWFRPAGAFLKPTGVDLTNDELHYRILGEFERDPRLLQRQLAHSFGVSDGKINYCVRALVGKGLLAYAYQLTPRGLAAKARITRRFIEIKQREYGARREGIDRLQREVGVESLG